MHETLPFYLRSPYAAAKLNAYWITVNYRKAFGMYVCNGILFNHEFPLCGENFVTGKITSALARIKLGLQDRLYKIGNLDAKRDWGHAKDYVEMQWLMQQQEQSEDFIIATGMQYSVCDFVNAAAEELGIKVRWEGQGIDEKGYDSAGKCIVAVDIRYFRPTEVETLLGDATKARLILSRHQRFHSMNWCRKWFVKTLSPLRVTSLQSGTGITQITTMSKLS